MISAKLMLVVNRSAAIWEEIQRDTFSLGTGDIASEMMFVSRMSMSLNSGFGNGFAGRDFQIDSSKRLEYIADCFEKFPAGSGTSARLDFIQFGPQDFPCLLLHGPPILRGANTKLALGTFGKLTNGDAGHAINDITAINDCKSENY